MDINTYLAKGKTELRSLVSLKNASPTDIFELLSCARKLKTLSKFGELPKKQAVSYSILITKDKLSTTRIAFEIGADSLNIKPISLTLRGKSIEEYLNNSDLIKVLERYPVSSIVFDTENAFDAETATTKVLIPTICANELSGPCQTLAVLLTVWEKKKKLNNLKAVIVTDGLSQDHNLFVGMAKCGIDLTVVCHDNSYLDNAFLKELEQFSNVLVTNDLSASLKGSDIVYCLDHSLGSHYLITKELLDTTNDALFLQNIHFERNKQAENSVYDTHNCCIYDVGENMLHVIRACLNLIK